ncbi:MAG: transcription termination/antitermination protein NusG [Myxococcota bacterium]
MAAPDVDTTTDESETQPLAAEGASPEPDATNAGPREADADGDGSEVTPMKWYAVHAYSGYEAKVRDALKQRMQQFDLGGSFGEVLIPSETVTDTLASGTTRTRNKVSLPGYIFIQMAMNERTWHLVKDTPRVIGFIGNQNPRVVPSREIESMRAGIREGAVNPKPNVSFAVGEEVRVLDGAFANFTGTVDEVNGDKQKVKVIVSIFGRPTSVELDFSKVEKR